VLRLERDDRRSWVLRRLTFDTRSPRALALSADEQTLFVADGEPSSEGDRELRSYPVRADGSLGKATVLHCFGEDRDGPHRGIEGLCLDSEGNIVACAGWHRSGPGPLIYVFSPAGRVLETFEFAGDQPVRCAFGGPNLDTLYVTTAAGELYAGRIANRVGMHRKGSV
jgi:gluconolactonase